MICARVILCAFFHSKRLDIYRQIPYNIVTEKSDLERQRVIPLHFIPLCLLAIKKDDDRIFMQMLYAEHHLLMYRAALQYVHNLPDAEDVVNSACESLLKNIHLLRSVDPKAHSAYLLSTIQNQAKMFLRRQKRECSAMERLYHEQNASDAPDVTDEVIYRYTLHEIRDLLQQLCPEDQLVLKLKCFDHLENSEIAQVMDIAESTVRSRLCRARQRLHALMEEVESRDL